MKTNPLLTPLLTLGALVAPLQATTIVDDFNRANVGPTDTGSDIGTGWVIGGTSTWEISSNRVRINTNALGTVVNADSVMWNTGLSLSQGDFTTSLTRFSATNPRSSGIAFMVQDADSYYAFRFGPESGSLWEFVENDNGAVSVLQSGNASANWSSTTAYDITVSSTAANSYSFNVVNLSSSTTVVNTTITQSGLPLTGYAGLYYEDAVPTFQYVWDDFSATTPIPEPSSAALLIGAVAGMVLLRRRRNRAGQTRKI